MKILRVGGVAMAAGLVTSMAYGGDMKPASARSQVIVSNPLSLMSSPRAVHAAVTLADGRVALIGGCVVDGCEIGPGSRTIDIFDPKTMKLSPGGRLTTARIGAAAVVLSDGRVLIAGGWTGPQTTASIELYDPKTRTSVGVGSLSRARADIAVVALNDGRVALIGGHDGRGPVADVDVFDPRTQRVARGPALGRARASGSAAVRLNDGRVLVAGGMEGAGDRIPSAVVEIADPQLKAWSTAGPLVLARYKHAAVVLKDGRALVIGGSDARDRQGKIVAFEVFDPKANAFARAGATLTPRFKIGGTAVVLGDGRVFIGGGGERAEVYDPVTQRSVLVGPPLGAVRSFASASLLPDGRVVIAGGYEENSIAVSRGIWVVRP
jgi:hypothetical protein